MLALQSSQELLKRTEHLEQQQTQKVAAGNGSTASLENTFLKRPTSQQMAERLREPEQSQ